jgi:hypothetical protein
MGRIMYALQCFQRSIVDYPSEDIACYDEGIILVTDFIRFDRVMRGRCKRLQTIVIKFPAEIVHAGPFQFRRRNSCITWMYGNMGKVVGI